jgi:hypothetical protein
VTPVVDSHVHIFPYLDEPSGFVSQAEHRQFLQLYMATHGEPVRRSRDHVQVHGQTLHDGRLTNPSSLRAVDFRVGRFREQFTIELLYPIQWARTHEYPFPELRPAVECLYRRTGAERLVWGSDMPNVERNCTYRQSLEYLRILADGWLSAADLDRILGLNALRLFEIDNVEAHP